MLVVGVSDILLIQSGSHTKAATWSGYARDGYRGTSLEFSCPENTVKHRKDELLRRYKTS